MSESLVQKLRNVGPGSLSSIELLAISLSENEGEVEKRIRDAVELLGNAQGIRSVGDLSFAGLGNRDISPFAVARFRACVELGKRTADAARGGKQAVTEAAEVARLFRHLEREKKEHFCMALLDTKNHIFKWTTVHVGTLDSSIVGIKEFFREAILEGAASVIAVHNHPSGDPTPSKEDFEVTRVLRDAGRLLEIPLLDHVIVGANDYRSLRELGAIG